MTAKPKRDGATVVGLGAAACVACCAGPILAFLGGIGRGFEEFEAGVMVAVGTIGCGDERALINDQHWSIATEPVGEEFVDLVADAVLARPDSSEAQVPSAWRSRDGGTWSVSTSAASSSTVTPRAAAAASKRRATSSETFAVIDMT